MDIDRHHMRPAGRFHKDGIRKLYNLYMASYERSGYNTIKGAFKWDTTDIQKKEKHAMSDI